MFNQSALGGTSSFGATTTPSSANPMKDFEVTSPPDDSVSSLAFSPATIPQNFLIAGSWDNNVSIFYCRKQLHEIYNEYSPVPIPLNSIFPYHYLKSLCLMGNLP